VKFEKNADKIGGSPPTRVRRTSPGVVAAGQRRGLGRLDGALFAGRANRPEVGVSG
jgi:hypothetical protein